MTISIVEGIVSGVATGIVLAIVFGVRQQVLIYRERKDQIQHLAILISTYRERMYRITYPVPGIEPPSTDVGKDIFRKVTFEQMKKEINAALDGRCSRLSFDEIYELRRSINDWSSITDNWKEPKLQWTDVFCGNIFGALAAIKWLKLPKGPDFYGSGGSRKDVY